jgi:hypothetical protein
VSADPHALSAAICELEAKGQGRVIVFGATNLDIDLLPPLYETLRGIGRADRLDVVVFCRGGSVNAARRIALLLHEFTDRLRFIVPHYCESAATLMVLAAREIVAGPLAVFSPTDPHLTSAEGGRDGSPSALSSQDIRLFRQMSQDWFGMDQQQAQERALSLLCESIFPTTLTSLYRCTREVQSISNELLALHLPDSATAQRAKIADTLLFDFHSHTYALTRDDLARIGLPVARDTDIEAAAWEIACHVRARIGAGSRQSLEGDWYDALLATRDSGMRRRRSHDAIASVWDVVETR